MGFLIRCRYIKRKKNLLILAIISGLSAPSEPLTPLTPLTPRTTLHSKADLLHPLANYLQRVSPPLTSILNKSQNGFQNLHILPFHTLCWPGGVAGNIRGRWLHALYFGLLWIETASQCSSSQFPISSRFDAQPYRHLCSLIDTTPSLLSVPANRKRHRRHCHSSNSGQ
jgi:hypothetical protein